MPKTTASEQAYTRLKAMIGRGELPPGTELIAQTFADQMEISRTPIVEAFRRLERDGLVEYSPKWGASVKQWTDHEVYEAYCVRRVLEGEAARLFVLHASPANKDKLIELSLTFDECCVSDLARAQNVDLELHLHIARSTGFKRLYQLIESSGIATMIIYGLASALVKDSAERRERFEQSIGRHNALVEALLSDDPDKATRAMWEHIDEYLKYINKVSEVTGKAALYATK